MTDESAENNDKAVAISEELDFLDEVMKDSGQMPAEVTDKFIARRDALRSSLAPEVAAEPDETAEEGTVAPDPEDTVTA